jgi:hypothetical protein
MMAMIATIVGGVFERFPKLSIAYLESGIGWVPYMMDRLDEEVEKRGAKARTWPNSGEHLSGRIYFGVSAAYSRLPSLGFEDTLSFIRYPIGMATSPYG